MKKGLFILLITVLLLVLTVGIASAITDGELDDEDHPYVGLMVAHGWYEVVDDEGEPVEVYGPMWRCSGTLLSETVFLTAGHCTEAPADHVEVWFDTGPIDLDPAYISVNDGGEGCANTSVIGYPCQGEYAGVPYTHPDYDPDAFYLHDVGVVVLDSSVPAIAGKEYGELPTLDQFDTIVIKRKQDITFTAVGYGLQISFPDAATWKEQADRVRMVAYPFLIQINAPGFTGDYSLLLSNNPNTGGTCFGDSGGPNFLGDTNIVAGVTSFGMNPKCAGTGGVFRMDRANVIDWVNSCFDGVCDQ